MYSANYGFGNAGAGQPYNNAAPQQPGGQPTPQQQQQQHLMYNQQQQQFAGMAPQGAFPPGANPQMMAGNPAAMMQNPGMSHMAANGQMPGYQQQFPSAAYGQGVPSSVGPQSFAPNNYMMAGGGMQGFQMNQQGMSQQAQMMQQRMPQQVQHQQHQQAQQQQQHQQAQAQHHQQQNAHASMGQASTPQRPPSSAQGTPNNAMHPQQAQFQTPQQTPSQPHAPANFQQQVHAGMTPNTPTFPQNQVPQQMAQGAAAAMPPEKDARDKERFALLLDINHELLYESIQIQTSQQEIKKELAAEGKLTPDRKPTEEEALLQQDYVQCMKRLQANLTYMAALADRKPDTKPAPCPAYMNAPNLTLSVKLRAQPIVPEGGDFKIDPVTDREERDLAIKELYGRLQGCFPGIDPNKEHHFRAPALGQKPGSGPQGFSQPSPTTHKTPQMTHMPAPQNHGGVGS